MSDQLISQVGNVQIDISRVVQSQNQASASPQQSVNVVDQGKAVRPIESDEEEKPKEEKNEIKHETNMQKMVDVFLKFQVDKESKDITIYVLDRGSREVIRTIPAEDLTKMSVGQFLELFV